VAPGRTALHAVVAQRIAERGWTVAEAADRCGLPTRTLYSLLARQATGARPPTLEALADGLQLPLRELRTPVGITDPESLAMVQLYEQLDRRERSRVLDLLADLLRERVSNPSRAAGSRREHINGVRRKKKVPSGSLLQLASSSRRRLRAG
jgi:transcriptional regulator with XRE-family HTH domain